MADRILATNKILSPSLVRFLNNLNYCRHHERIIIKWHFKARSFRWKSSKVDRLTSSSLLLTTSIFLSFSTIK